MTVHRPRAGLLPTLVGAAAAAAAACAGAPSAFAQMAVAPPATSQAAALEAAPHCTSLTDDRERLACYDRLHGRADAAPKMPDTPSAATPLPPTSPGPTLLTPGTAVQPPPLRSVADAAKAQDPCTRLPQAAGSARSYLGSTLSERWELSCRDQMPRFLPRPYRPVYLLPVSWTSRTNREPLTSASEDNGVVDALSLDKNEAKFQVSLKSKIWSSDDEGSFSVWGAYTQSSRWQVYNGRVSRPFRETNYEPELIFAKSLDVDLPFGWKARMASLSLNHQSNGRAQPLSRSWNRVIGDLSLERGETTVSLRPWWRVRESSSADDNPQIENYIGRAELLVTQKWGRHVFSFTGRHNLRAKDSRGSAQVDWAFPLFGSGLHGYVQLFSGYGESLIDYNFHETRLGLGVSVIEWR